MSEEQLIAEFKALPAEERQQVAAAILENESWIPESFRAGMADIEQGRTISFPSAMEQEPRKTNS